jgi:hypothetical protein
LAPTCSGQIRCSTANSAPCFEPHQGPQPDTTNDTPTPCEQRLDKSDARSEKERKDDSSPPNSNAAGVSDFARTMHHFQVREEKFTVPLTWTPQIIHSQSLPALHSSPWLLPLRCDCTRLPPSCPGQIRFSSANTAACLRRQGAFLPTWNVHHTPLSSSRLILLLKVREQLMWTVPWHRGRDRRNRTRPAAKFHSSK